MKKILISIFALASSCFAELKITESKRDYPLHFFFGAGLGVGANAIELTNIPDPLRPNYLLAKEQSLASFVVSFKLGMFQNLSEQIKLRYYYNLDINATSYDEFLPSYYALSASHTLNADVLYNVFANKSLAVDVIGGVGLGAVFGDFNVKIQDTYNTASKFVNADLRFNLGSRVMFDQKYGLELMVKLPVIPNTQVYASGRTRSIKQSPFYFTLDFVFERF